MKTKGIIQKLIYGYLLLPFLIFLLGWCKWYFALPIAIVVLFCGWRLMYNSKLWWEPEWSRKNLEKALFIILIAMLWVYFSGIGKLVYQNDDHIWRNALFNTLVSEPWPVVGKVDMGGILDERGLTYYIGFWMPCAIIGKLFGLKAGYYFQAAWATLGLLFVYYCICVYRKKLDIWPFGIFVFFSGLDIVGCYFLGYDLSTLSFGMHLEWWAGFQFSSFTTQLFWVFNQALPAWLFMMVLLLQKENRFQAFLLALSMLNCTLPFIGMLPFVLYLVFANRKKGSKIYTTK